MIAFLKGTIITKSPESTIIDVNGIGYEVFTPLSTFYETPDPGSPVRLHTYTHVREDALQLYGFSTVEEKTMFMHLLGISGIGPKLAVNILSGITIDELERAIVDENTARITRVPGVGRKTAERIIIELRDKMKKKVTEPLPGKAGKVPASAVFEDAVSALVNLGYKKASAESALHMINDMNGLTLEEILKKALRILSKI